jgi:hypothetical protein
MPRTSCLGPPNPGGGGGEREGTKSTPDAGGDFWGGSCSCRVGDPPHGALPCVLPPTSWDHELVLGFDALQGWSPAWSASATSLVVMSRSRPSLTAAPGPVRALGSAVCCFPRVTSSARRKATLISVSLNPLVSRKAMREDKGVWATLGTVRKSKAVKLPPPPNDRALSSPALSSAVASPAFIVSPPCPPCPCKS